MNLGSPDSPSPKDVARYLREFLMDERVLDINKILRTILVKGIIAPIRSYRSAKAYKSIWWESGSPLVQITKQLQSALRIEMPDTPIEIAMRYGNPSTKYAYDKLMQSHPDLERVVIVPLYPHYAMSSYETAAQDGIDVHRAGNYPFELVVVPPFYNKEAYLNALTESIRPHIQKDFDLLLFSYHGIPERHIKKSDVTHSHCLKTADCCNVASPAHAFCYRHQDVFTTMEVGARLGLPKNKFTFSFQSRLGRDPWLTPYTAKRLKELPKEGIKKIVVVCPAFVSDCLETLEEMGEEGREFFLEAGGEEFTLVPCMNTEPTWVHGLKSIIEDSMNSNSQLEDSKNLQGLYSKI